MTRTRGLFTTKPHKPNRRHRDNVEGLLNREDLAMELELALARAARDGRPLVLVRLSATPAHDRTRRHEQMLAVQHSCAERITAHLGNGDSLAHLGELEFAVLIRTAEHTAGAAAVAHGLLDAFRRPLLTGSTPLHAGATAGVAVYPRDAGTAAQLLAAADDAASRAKRGAPGHLAFSSPKLDDVERRDRQAREGLGTAIERGELVLHYQPVLDLRHGEVAAVEALIRWQHPERGLIPPLDFIPTAEDTGQIVTIGKWALLQACRQARLWDRAGMPVRMAVNLSVRQFSSPGLVEHVEAALSETGLEPQRLELELTESMFADPEASSVVLERLRALGVRVAIDDFGTGFSSLSYLTQFPLDTIKIDRSFITRSTHDREAAAVVGTVIAMAHDLDLETVAEGVETEAQEQLLVTHGCDLLQGFLHSPPLPPGECERWLHQRLARPLTALPGGGGETGAHEAMAPPHHHSRPAVSERRHRTGRLTAGAR